MSTTVDLRPTRRAAFPAALTIGVVLIAVNLRPAVASVGAVIGDLRGDTGLSAGAAAVLTSAPIVCFGALAPAAPRLARRWGLRPALGGLLALMTLGLVVRVLGGSGATGEVVLFAGTVVAAGAIACANVLVPALIKQDYPHRAGAAMGLYTTALTLAAAVAVGASVPAERALGGGWRTALGLWALPAAVAFVVWLPVARAREAGPAVPPRTPGTLLREPLAWQVLGFFGMQAASFYAVLAWLPTLFRDAGYSPAAAGGLVSLSAFLQAPVSLVVPVLATRLRDQRWLVLACTGFAAGGLLGILLAPAGAPLLWVLLLGIGQGAAFPLGLTLVVLRTGDADVTARLSAMAQGGGYLIAALGPLLVGILHDLTGGWGISVGLLMVLLVPQAICGYGAGRNRLARPRRRPDAPPSATRSENR